MKTKREMREAAIKRLNEMYETGPYTTQDIVVALAGSSGWVGRIIDLLTDDEPQYDNDAYAMGPRDADGILWFRGDMSDSEWGVIERTYFDGERWMVCGHDISAPWIPADSIRHAPMCTATQREDDLIELIKDAARDYVGIQTYYRGLLREFNRFCDDSYMQLPRDVNGEVIHIGDELCGYYYSKGGVYCKAIVNERTILVGEDDEAYGDWLMWDAKDCQHYHRPTIEDVLREFAEKVTDSQIPGTHPTYEEAIAEYAKRMQLKEDE